MYGGGQLGLLLIEETADLLSKSGGGNRREVVARYDAPVLEAVAEGGYNVDALIARRNKRGRPTIGTAAASVESVRLDPELRRQLIERAQSEGTTPSELIREALRRYLHGA